VGYASAATFNGKSDNPVSLVMLFFAVVSLVCLLTLNSALFNESTLQLALILLGVVSAVLMMVALVPFVLSFVLTQQRRAAGGAPGSSLVRGPDDQQVARYGK
jgi:hypothetical protein